MSDRSRSISLPKSTDEGACTIFVLGASGDLAHKKTYPSLFDLFTGDLLPAGTNIIGYARSPIEEAAFRSKLRGYLKNGTAEQIEAFLSRCSYCHGGYDDAAAFANAAKSATALEDGSSHNGVANRLFYFAVPPAVFTQCAESIHKSGLTTRGWNRLIIEKPFGADSESSAKLSKELGAFFREDQIYRIDHYLGKEMVQNLMVLRFANAVFEPLWNRQHISNVQITFKEPFGTEGRGGYFDSVGIVRDVMQNHLMQVMSLVAMEPPVSMSADAIRDEKVKVLKCTAPVRLEEMVLGQYTNNASGSKQAYLADAGVAKDSTTPTFATAVLHINNARWKGVPFILKCGKALNERKAEIRIQFTSPCSGLFPTAPEEVKALGVGQTAASGFTSRDTMSHNNELVIRIQPNEAVYLKLMSKMPGLEFVPVETELSLSYKSRYPTRPPPEAYARLILDVLRGDQSQFVRNDELAAAWEIFTPVLHRMEREKVRPLPYPFGSRGPIRSDKLIKDFGYVYEGKYAGEWNASQDPGAGAETLATIRESFLLPTDRLVAVIDAMLGEMQSGLRGDASTIKMIPTHVTDVPKGTETGAVWAIDMGGSNLRVVEVKLGGHGTLDRGVEKKKVIPQNIMEAPADTLFDFVVDLMVEAGVPNGASIGFTFSFPVDQTAINAGTLINWTKGFKSAGVVGHDVIELLQAACTRRGLDVKLDALVNDTVGTLMARAYSDTRCRVGVILGTGTNACYVEHCAAIDKWKGCRDGYMVINMEWGNFGSSAHVSHLPFHIIDQQIDALSPNEGEQRFEKMISGMYLGEMVRLLLLQLYAAGAVFTAKDFPKRSARGLETPNNLPAEAVSTILEDDSEDLSGIAGILRSNLGLESSINDRRIVKEMCSLVGQRAARLAAAGVAAVMAQMRTDGTGVSVGIDGSVFKKFPHFDEWMREALKELAIHCDLVTAEDGSGIGAALVALVASKIACAGKA